MYIPNKLYISGFINIFIIYLIYLVINSFILIISIFLIKYIFLIKNSITYYDADTYKYFKKTMLIYLCISI